MARGRLLSTEASVDPELNSLTSESMLLYLLTLPHLDRDGLTDGHPLRLTAIAAPLRFELRDGAGSLIDEWVEAGLVARYGAGNGRLVLFFKGFRKHQLGLEYGKEPASKFPPPPGWTRTREGLVPDDAELCFRLAEGLHGKSAYRGALLKAAGADVPAAAPEPATELETEPETAPALVASAGLREDFANSSRSPREVLANSSRLREEKRREEKINKHGDGDALTPPTPVMAIGGVQGGAASQAASGAPGEFSEEELRTAAYQLGSTLSLHVDWTGYDAYLAKRSPPTLWLLLEWIYWYSTLEPAVLVKVMEKIDSLPAVIRSNLNQGAKAPLTTVQRQRLHQQIGTVLVAASSEEAV